MSSQARSFDATFTTPLMSISLKNRNRSIHMATPGGCRDESGLPYTGANRIAKNPVSKRSESH